MNDKPVNLTADLNEENTSRSAAAGWMARSVSTQARTPAERMLLRQLLCADDGEEHSYG